YLNSTDTLIVKGKFENRNNKKQLIINQIENVASFESNKLANAKQVIIRNIESLSEIKQWLNSQETADDIPVKYFQEKQNQFKIIGFISREKEKIEVLISKFSPWDIRII
ncbi:DNA polymerase III subunit alpha, partial [Staphylococcus cohnii]